MLAKPHHDCAVRRLSVYGRAMGKNHPPTQEEIARAMTHFRAKEKQRLEFAEKYGDMRVPQVVRAGNKLYSAIEGGLYAQTYEGDYNFPNVLHDHALLFFGVPYLEDEEKRPLGQRHPALQWMYNSVEHNQARIKNKVSGYDQQGFTAAWLRFAYDLYTIRDNAKLERRMKKRLLSKREFQGARHDLKVAAVCVAAGFHVEFENEKDNSIGHAEFIGTSKSGLRIAVEAKSRHRYGVHSFKGGKQVDPGAKANIRDIILDAYKKRTDLPLYAFIDANLPPAVNKEQLYASMGEIHDTMADLEKEGYAEPCSANALFVCNDPSHYVGNRQIDNDTDNLWIMDFEAVCPRVPHPELDVSVRLKRAYTQRIAPPEDIPQF